MAFHKITCSLGEFPIAQVENVSHMHCWLVDTGAFTFYGHYHSHVPVPLPNHTVLTRSYLHGLVVLVVKKRCASPSHAEATSNRVKERANSVAQIACSRHARIVWEKPKRC